MLDIIMMFTHSPCQQAMEQPANPSRTPATGGVFQTTLGHKVLEVTWAPKPYTLNPEPQEPSSMPKL